MWRWPRLDRDVSAGSLTGRGLEAMRSRAPSRLHVATAYCQGTPLRNEIEGRDGADLATATTVCAAALAARFGSQAVEGKIQAHVIAVEVKR